MATLTFIDEEGFVQCSECDVTYQVVWSRNPVYDRLGYCPFCGEEIE
jgi:uncharacterized Zn-finger protein